MLKRRRVIRACVMAALLVAVGLCALDRSGGLAYRGDDFDRFDRKSVQIVGSDADVLRIRLENDSEATARLLGVAAPEPGGWWSDKCAVYLRNRTVGRTVILRLDPLHTRDASGRLVAYVFINDSDNLNMDIIHDGQAFADRRHRHLLAPQLELAESQARAKKYGLWKDLTDDQMPQWRLEWLKSLRK